MSFSDGTVNIPSINFTNDTDTGIYLRAAGDMSVAVNGNAVASFNTRSISTNLPVWLTSGTVTHPSLALQSDQTTGFYKVGSGALGFASAGVQALILSADGIKLPVSNTAGRPGSPVSGLLRVNNQTSGLDVFIGSTWVSLTTPLVYSVASTGDILVGTDNAKYVTAAGIRAAEVFTTITLTPDNATFINGKISLTSNSNTFNAFANPKEGRSGCIAITQDGVGSRLATFNGWYDFEGSAPTLSTGANKTDYVFYVVRAGGTSAICTFKKAL